MGNCADCEHFKKSEIETYLTMTSNHREIFLISIIFHKNIANNYIEFIACNKMHSLKRVTIECLRVYCSLKKLTTNSPGLSPISL